MAIIVEDGTGLTNANSYCSVQFADQYFAERLNTSWDNLDSDVKQSCLIKATQYMRQQFRNLWKGRRRLTTQSLDWPRTDVVVDDETYVAYNVIPTEVKNACAELALRANIGELNADLSQGVLEETVGPLKVKYDSNSSRRVSYNTVLAELRPFFKDGSSGANIKLVRC